MPRSIWNGGGYTPLVPASGPVGGVAQLPDASDSPPSNYIALVELGAAAVAALCAGAWYARRWWLS